jgi:hypothetical protein
MSGTARQRTGFPRSPTSRPARPRASVAAASWLVAAFLALLPAGPATAQQLGDFGRLQPGVVNDDLLPLLDPNRKGTNGKPLHGMNVTDEEIEMRDRIWRFLAAPQVKDWAWPYTAEIRPVGAGGGTPKQIGKYYRWLSSQRYDSSHARFNLIGQHAGQDVGVLPDVFRSICTVFEIDRQRGVAVAQIDALDPQLSGKVEKRDRDNRQFIYRFVLGLTFRYNSYQYALDQFLVETPAREAVDVDRVLTELGTWVDRANQLDFCSEDTRAGGGGDKALPSRVLLDAPSEGQYRK